VCSGITAEATDGATVRLAPVYIQPMAAADVAEAVAAAAVEPPLNGITEVAGPQRYRLDDLVRRTLASRNDPRTVVSDPDAGYFGAAIGAHTLTPGDEATTLGARLEDWVTTQTPVPAS
jgi:uncharacterized protein YbjT (DUF2867 family)